MALQDALRDGLVNPVKASNAGPSQGFFTSGFARSLEMPLSKPIRAPAAYLKEDLARGKQLFSVSNVWQNMEEDVIQGLERNLFQLFRGNIEETAEASPGHTEASSPRVQFASSNRAFNPSESQDSIEQQPPCV
ncbi:hypothetical protein L7F22_021680, partial [Adiantum nelumboides]|nr:hypothetical protein [Adiantum nelumboides]